MLIPVSPPLDVLTFLIDATVGFRIQPPDDEDWKKKKKEKDPRKEMRKLGSQQKVDKGARLPERERGELGMELDTTRSDQPRPAVSDQYFRFESFS